jgi:hypothetical protein
MSTVSQSLPAFSVNLYETGDSGASFRLRNAPGETQREYIIEEGSDLTVQGNLITVVHGTWTYKGVPATLIVAEFTFLSSRDASQVFRRADISFTFESILGRRNPEVLAIAPFGHFSLDPTLSLSGAKLTMGLGVTAGFAGIATVEPKLQRESTNFAEKEDSGKIIGYIRIGGRPRAPPYVKNQAGWILTENKSQKSGIPHLLRTAMLVGRHDGAPFRAKVAVNADVDIAYSIRRCIRKVMGLSKVDPVIFDPERAPMGIFPEGLDTENLVDFDLEGEFTVISTSVLKTAIGP